MRCGITEHKFDVSNLLSIPQLKELYVKAESKKQAIYASQLRLFYQGKECKDDLFVYSYEMADDMTVTVMIRKKPE